MGEKLRTSTAALLAAGRDQIRAARSRVDNTRYVDPQIALGPQHNVWRSDARLREENVAAHANGERRGGARVGRACDSDGRGLEVQRPVAREEWKRSRCDCVLEFDGFVGEMNENRDAGVGARVFKIRTC